MLVAKPVVLQVASGELDRSALEAAGGGEDQAVARIARPACVPDT